MKVSKYVSGRMKRVFDTTLAMMLLVISAPVMIVVALAVSFTGLPVIYSHSRVGRGGVEFSCLKFRTMVNNADEVLSELLSSDDNIRKQWELERKIRSDPRVTKVGAWLRKTSLDELPQLFNVVKGDMSLVGPRPVTKGELIKYGLMSSNYLACRPGLTGLWQVSGRSEVDYRERVSMDAKYSLEATLVKDLSILVRTVGVVIRRSGAY